MADYGQGGPEGEELGYKIKGWGLAGRQSYSVYLLFYYLRTNELAAEQGDVYFYTEMCIFKLKKNPQAICMEI